MKRTASIITGLAAALAVAAVTAQPYGMGPGPGMGYGMGPGAGMHHGMGPGAGRGAPSAADVDAFVDARLADLKARLNITTNQESAWQAYADQAKQNAQQHQAMRAQMWNSSGSAADRMAQRAGVMQQRADQMAAMSKAVTSLYAVLTPEQKSVADQYFAPGGGRGGRFGWRG